MFHLSTNSTAVSVDGMTGRPAAIRTDGRRAAVTVVESVRDETAAYPAGQGPRTVFIVRTQDRRYRLVHLLRERRWTLEELAPTTAQMVRAA